MTTDSAFGRELEPTPHRPHDCAEAVWARDPRGDDRHTGYHLLVLSRQLSEYAETVETDEQAAIYDAASEILAELCGGKLDAYWYVVSALESERALIAGEKKLLQAAENRKKAAIKRVKERAQALMEERETTTGETKASIRNGAAIWLTHKPKVDCTITSAENLLFAAPQLFRDVPDMDKVQAHMARLRADDPEATLAGVEYVERTETQVSFRKAPKAKADD